ncbi:MAG TPA: HAMP domain-containing sensor histidine kinase [Thermoanaerobaculia bacterium]|nr:HAMP domain-containing sensor histidine kinase [Thermoanaerobaculia bacterium]
MMKSWMESFAKSAFQRSSDTAHDLKTPLNIAVLNLELLRMRVRKLSGIEDDPKLDQYSKAIEVELRRIAQIVDSYFLLSSPPKGSPDPELVDVGPLLEEAARKSGIPLKTPDSASSDHPMMLCHPTRAREMVKSFFEGAARLSMDGQTASCIRNVSALLITVEGRAPAGEFDTAKVFKFYYTDASGNPELSLASARLIAETYGGDLTAIDNGGELKLTLTVPLGE